MASHSYYHALLTVIRCAPWSLQYCLFFLEYQLKFHHGTLPGRYWHGEGFHDPYAHVFFGFYFVMTGLHGLHVLIGMGLMAWAFIRSGQTRFTRSYYTPVENVAMYWALVDLVWVFLFPLLYLIG